MTDPSPWGIIGTFYRRWDDPVIIYHWERMVDGDLTLWYSYVVLP